MDDTSRINHTNMNSMLNLMSEMQIIHNERQYSESTLIRVREIVEESSRLVQNVVVPGDLVIDAKIIHMGSDIVRENVQAFDANLKSFNEEEYVTNLSTGFGDDWDRLAKQTCLLFRSVPPLDFMLGTFQLDPPKAKIKVKQEKISKSAVGETKVLSAIGHTEQEEDATDKLCEHVLGCLVRKYKQNKKQPVNFLVFIVDPGDFWRTVQNIFHFSFLVRDGKVCMFLDDKGFPVVKPQINNSSQNDAVSNNQFNFRINPPEWRQIIKKFNITEAAIQPLIKDYLR